MTEEQEKAFIKLQYKVEEIIRIFVAGDFGLSIDLLTFQNRQRLLMELRDAWTATKVERK